MPQTCINILSPGDNARCKTIVCGSLEAGQTTRLGQCTSDKLGKLLNVASDEHVQCLGIDI